MDNEKDAVSDFLNGVTEDRDLFKEEPTVTQESNETEDKPIPFHKDPKVQRYVEKQIEKALRDKPSVEQQFRQEVTQSDVKDVISAFTAIIGNDTPEKVKALEALEKTLNGADERASQKAIERFQKQQEELIQKATEADKRAQYELDNYFDEIEENYNVDLTSNSASAKQLRSQFIEYVRKVAPKDEKGEVERFPDLVGAFEEFQERNKRTASRAKELANRGITRSSDTTVSAPQGKSWKDVERYISKLTAK